VKQGQDTRGMCSVIWGKDLEDDPRSVRSSTSQIADTIANVREIVTRGEPPIAHDHASTTQSALIADTQAPNG
jgi:hypothetical protein